MNPDTDKSCAKWEEGVEHVRFVVRLYQNQIREGRVFLHEHPAHAKSWMLKEIRNVMKMEGVDVVEADQCMYGLRINSTS